ncbi:7-deoxyloganetin glucosyltransferase-like [Alnus glutinosa]|uniref:7-deoxyloganetin glucosyltransferase-like n=1 Tax=Alnus glutinosa TaxID=3517 RepID=UPI002D794E6D|nr:7-deoxyloganetin glucosyltransferase-like [Alnus glutinosa]
MTCYDVSPQWGFRFRHRVCGDENTLKNSQKAADRARRPKLPEGTRAPVETCRNSTSGRPLASEKKYKPGHGGDESGYNATYHYGSTATIEKPHAVCIPFPAQGHINPMLKMAKILHYRGFHITFINTEFNHKRLLKSRGPNSLNGLPSFRFETIPDGLPESDVDATQDIASICDSTRKHCLAPFRNHLSKLNDTSSSNVPPVTCIVSDGAMTFTLDAAAELGIPEVLFWTASACGYMGYVQYRRLIEMGLTPLKDASYLTNGHLDTVIDWVPGMKGIRLRDLPSFIRTTNPDEIMLNFPMVECERAQKASALIFNTFDALEHEVLDALSSMFPPIYSIGPLQLLLNQIPDSDHKSIGSNLWKEDVECLEWLDKKEANSVVYVNFGSIMVMTSDQLIEFAWGLANSNQTFLWIIRPDLVDGDSAVLPPEFLEETKERGLLASWCPQEQVLSHPSIGGFLTHSGWNSTIESVCGGVPIISWPFFADQQTNCRYSCNEWGIGMEIEGGGKRGEIERLVRELMVGEKRKELKKKAVAWKKLAEEATSRPTGSSYMNIDKVINEVLLSARH